MIRPRISFVFFVICFISLTSVANSQTLEIRSDVDSKSRQAFEVAWLYINDLIQKGIAQGENPEDLCLECNVTVTGGKLLPNVTVTRPFDRDIWHKREASYFKDNPDIAPLTSLIPTAKFLNAFVHVASSEHPPVAAYRRYVELKTASATLNLEIGETQVEGLASFTGEALLNVNDRVDIVGTIVSEDGLYLKLNGSAAAREFFGIQYNAQKALQLVGIMGASTKTHFQAVMNAQGELVGAKEITSQGVSSLTYPATITPGGLRLVTIDDLAYTVFYVYEEGEFHAMFRGTDFFKAVDNGELFIGCAYHSSNMDIAWVCSSEGHGFPVRAQDITNDNSTNRYIVVDSNNEPFEIVKQ